MPHATLLVPVDPPWAAGVRLRRPVPLHRDGRCAAPPSLDRCSSERPHRHAIARDGAIQRIELDTPSMYAQRFAAGTRSRSPVGSNQAHLPCGCRRVQPLVHRSNDCNLAIAGVDSSFVEDCLSTCQPVQTPASATARTASPKLLAGSETAPFSQPARLSAMRSPEMNHSLATE